jgi:hypothetical protein
MTAKHSHPDSSQPDSSGSIEFPKLNNLAPERRIWDKLSLHPQMIGFIPAATLRLIAISDEQTARLGIAAVEIAQKRGGTAVDVPDIQAADTEINNSAYATRVAAWLLTLGSILFGAALSTLVGLLRTGPPSHPAVWWGATILVAVVGLVLLIVGFPRNKKSTTQQ